MKMDCPESMLSAPVHICHYCGDLLERGYKEKDVGEASRKMQEGGFFDMLENSEEVADELTELKFKRIWKGDKKALMELSKSNLAREMFFQGMLYTLIILDMAGIINKMSREDLETFAKAMERGDQNKMSEISQKYLRHKSNEGPSDNIDEGNQPS